MPQPWLDLPVALAIVIDADSGAILLGAEHRLERWARMAEVEPDVAAHLRTRHDHGNGHQWLHLAGFSFGGEAAGLSLCFANGRLEMANWSVTLPGAEAGWPSRDDIDAEVRFVRAVLAGMIGSKPSAGETRLRWGSVWSVYDPRADAASHGLRYRQ